MTSLLPYISLISGGLLVFFILIQSRGASLGAGFGGSGELHTERRGVDKTLHQITIITAVVFVLSLLLIVVTA